MVSEDECLAHVFEMHLVTSAVELNLKLQKSTSNAKLKIHLSVFVLNDSVSSMIMLQNSFNNTLSSQQLEHQILFEELLLQW